MNKEKLRDAYIKNKLSQNNIDLLFQKIEDPDKEMCPVEGFPTYFGADPRLFLKIVMLSEVTPLPHLFVRCMTYVHFHPMLIKNYGGNMKDLYKENLNSTE